MFVLALLSGCAVDRGAIDLPRLGVKRVILVTPQVPEANAAGELSILRPAWDSPFDGKTGNALRAEGWQLGASLSPKLSGLQQAFQDAMAMALKQRGYAVETRDAIPARAELEEQDAILRCGVAPAFVHQTFYAQSYALDLLGHCVVDTLHAHFLRLVDMTDRIDNPLIERIYPEVHYEVKDLAEAEGNPAPVVDAFTQMATQMGRYFAERCAP